MVCVTVSLISCATQPKLGSRDTKGACPWYRLMMMSCSPGHHQGCSSSWTAWIFPSLENLYIEKGTKTCR